LTIPFGKTVERHGLPLPAQGTSDYNQIVAELAALNDALDAIGDLVTTESIYHMVRGNPPRAGGALEAVMRREWYSYQTWWIILICPFRPDSRPLLHEFDTCDRSHAGPENGHDPA
jgi:hypothetical protein